MTFKEYVIKNWDGWPLHSLIAGLLMWPVISNSFPLIMLLINIVLWPCREIWQHRDEEEKSFLKAFKSGFKNIWTWHRFFEWAAPVKVAIISYFIWT